MLTFLRVTNFALIEETQINFADGLNVLTGETGAGKSILIDALSTVLGSRASQDMIRSGSESFRIEAVFELPVGHPVMDYLALQSIVVEADRSLLLNRTVAKSGKNSIVINGCQVPLAVLRQVGDSLLDMHGQHENQSLLRPESYMELLDSFDADLQSLSSCYRIIYNEWRKIREEIESAEQDSKLRSQRLDMLQWQVEEINAARLVDGEDMVLEQEIQVMTHAEKISRSVALTLNALDEEGAGEKTVLGRLGICQRELANASRYDARLEDFAKSLDDCLLQLSELVPDIRDYAEDMEYDPGKLAKRQDRMDLIYKLKKKYGSTMAEVIEYGQKADIEIEQLMNFDARMEERQRNLLRLASELEKAANALDAKRRDAAVILGEELEKQLLDLGMPKARFAVKVEATETFTASGRNSVVFEFSANAGEEMRPLHRVASGGELSRMALAIKTVCSRWNAADVMVFDEIDAGIGGHTARRVAEKISWVAGRKQVLCITHLPQIACMADHHLHIEKQFADDRTKTIVETLSPEGQLEELARMIGGEPITRAGLENAAEMLTLARNYKQSALKTIDSH